MNQAISELMGVGDKLIMDPVHGGISLLQHEVMVIDHPLFQRLRSICQNDILSLVFPGATHSRFLHSIGTLHVGHRIYRAIIENCLRRTEPFAAQQEAKATQQWLSDINYFNKLVRLACLLHDCGHSSFSHQFTQTLSIQKLLDRQNLFKDLWRKIDTSRFYTEAPKKLEHEHYSVRCAYEILGQEVCKCAGIEMIDVLALMETTSAKLSRQFKCHAENIWPLLSGSIGSHPQSADHIRKLLKLIVSGEIDADRADYMLRDGFHSSVTLGGFNLDHLLKNLQVGWDATSNWMGLAITHKGLGALEDFVYSRHQMYRKVYGHKTAIGFDWILRKAIDEVMKESNTRQFIEECLTNIQTFRHLTDHYFWEQFRVMSNRRSGTYSSMIMDRRHLKHLHSVENLSASELTVKKQKVADFNGVKMADLVTCKINAKFSKIKGSYDAIKVINFKPKSERSDRYYSLISRESTFFNKFNDSNIVHFYMSPFH